MVGPGSAGVLQQLLLSLCGDGDEVIHASPCFDAYPLLIAIAGARCLPVPLTELGDHDLPEILARVTPPHASRHTVLPAQSHGGAVCRTPICADFSQIFPGT